MTHLCPFLFFLRTFSYIFTWTNTKTPSLSLLSNERAITSPSLLSFMQFLLLFAYVRHTVFLGLMLITGGWNIYFESCIICMSFRSPSLSLSLHMFAHYFMKTAALEVISLDISTHDSCKTIVFYSYTHVKNVKDIPFCPVWLLNISHTFAKRKYTQ